MNIGHFIELFSKCVKHYKNILVSLNNSAACCINRSVYRFHMESCAKGVCNYTVTILCTYLISHMAGGHFVVYCRVHRLG